MHAFFPQMADETNGLHLHRRVTILWPLTERSDAQAAADQAADRRNQ